MNRNRTREINYARSYSKRHHNTMEVREIIGGQDKGTFIACLKGQWEKYYQWPVRGPGKQISKVIATYKNGKKIK